MSNQVHNSPLHNTEHFLQDQKKIYEFPNINIKASLSREKLLRTNLFLKVENKILLQNKICFKS